MFDTEVCLLFQVTIQLFVWGLSVKEDGRGTLKHYVSNNIVRKFKYSKYLIRWHGCQWSYPRRHPTTLIKPLLSLSQRKREWQVKNQCKDVIHAWSSGPSVPVTAFLSALSYGRDQLSLTVPTKGVLLHKPSLPHLLPPPPAPKRAWESGNLKILMIPSLSYLPFFKSLNFF